MNKLTIRQLPKPEYACAEAMNTLCTNLSFAGENIRTIMVTSCVASEGKTFLSMNIAQAMAKLGRTVALVDADLRRSTLTSTYGIDFEGKEGLGLTHLLAGMAEEHQVIYETNLPGTIMVPVGRNINNALPLLVSPKFEELLQHLTQVVDYVIVDAPPVGVVIDAAEIAKYCDGSLVVVSQNAIQRQELIEVKRQLEQTECPILGTVLNKVKYDDYVSRKYYYKSYYYYGGDGKKKKKEKRKAE